MGGECADQLKKRLLRAGAPEQILEQFTDYGTLIGKLKKETRPVFLLPNYTAMMELRGALEKETEARGFWE